MKRYLSADFIFPIHQAPIKKGVIAINENQEITGLYRPTDSKLTNKVIEYFPGIISPGFINAHCHLELSHLVEQIPKHTTLIPFLQKVMDRKPIEKSQMDVAMQTADHQMYASGIVAVGDISNTIHSKEVKLSSNIHYHTFVEILGFDPLRASHALEIGETLRNSFLPLASSIVPHAPYSVSKELFLGIQKLSHTRDNLLTLHNQESPEENSFYQLKEGAFIDFYKSMNRAIDYFLPYGKNSLASILPWLPIKQRILFVHNTYTSHEDLNLLTQSGLDATWCLCPKANLYIENSLPDVNLLRKSPYKIVLGTDSLASNDKLCILSEIKTLHQHFPSLSLQETLTWATLNGAEFLGINHQYGSLEIGKKPGLNLISQVNNFSITENSTVKNLL